MGDYRDCLYSKYATQHVLPRKGTATVEEFQSRNGLYSAHFNRFLPHDRQARILDVGCGNGSLVWWLQRKGFANAEGIDLSPEQIDIAKALGVANVQRADAITHLARNTRSYSTIVARDLLEHLKKEEILDLLDLCREALMPGGTLVVQVPNASTPLASHYRYADFTHEVSFTMSSLRQVFLATGFSDPKFYPYDIPRRNRLKRWCLWKIAELTFKLMFAAELGRERLIVTRNLIGSARRPGDRDASFSDGTASGSME